MKKFRKILPVILLLCTILCGCENQDVYLPKTVTQVDITGTHLSRPIQRHYTEPQKMETVLNYLRLLDYKGTTTLDPLWLPGDDWSITLGFSTGESKQYRIRADRFLCRPSGVWEKVESEGKASLYPYLMATASDL